VSAWQKVVENIPKRHPAEPFDALAQEVDQLKKSLLSVETVIPLVTSLENVADVTGGDRFRSWQVSVVKFAAEFKSKFSSYPDVTVPILSGICDVVVAMQVSILGKKFLQTHPPITKAIRFFSHFFCTTQNWVLFMCSCQLNCDFLISLVKSLNANIYIYPRIVAILKLTKKYLTMCTLDIFVFVGYYIHASFKINQVAAIEFFRHIRQKLMSKN
jgi:hypothetical protein